MKLNLFLLLMLCVFCCVGFTVDAFSVDDNLLICPQNISGTFTLYGSHNVVQNGATWNYGPFTANTPTTIKLNHANTTNQIQGITPGLIAEPAVICKGETNGVSFVFMTNPVPPQYDNVPNFHANPVGLIAWEFYDR